MKLQTIIDFRDRIGDLEDLVNVMEDDFLNVLDDDLWTVGLESKPCFTDDYDVQFVTDVRLTKKYVMRFAEDYGLSLKDFKEVNDGFLYLFEVGEDYMKNISML